MQVACEIVSEQVVRIVPQPGAELAIQKVGGLRALLLRAGVDLGMQLTAAEVQLLGSGRAAGATGGGEGGMGAVAVPDAAGASAAPAAASQVAGDAGDATQEPAATPLPVQLVQQAQQPPTPPPPGSAVKDWPSFQWELDEQVFFRMAHCEAVQAALQRSTPALLARGGGIPGATLRAYRCARWWHVHTHSACLSACLPPAWLAACYTALSAAIVPLPADPLHPASHPASHPKPLAAARRACRLHTRR